VSLRTFYRWLNIVFFSALTLIKTASGLINFNGALISVLHFLLTNSSLWDTKKGDNNVACCMWHVARRTYAHCLLLAWTHVGPQCMQICVHTRPLSIFAIGIWQHLYEHVCVSVCVSVLQTVAEMPLATLRHAAGRLLIELSQQYRGDQLRFIG